MRVQSVVTLEKWRFRLRRTSFGLTLDYIKDVYEQFFFLKHYGGWSFTEAYSLPVGLRTWFVERLVKQINDEVEAKQPKKKNRMK